jgi:prophage antirepressor-like protein
MRNYNLIQRTFATEPVRVVDIEGEPWFVAVDVMRALGFTSTASAAWLARHLDEDERKHVARSTITVAGGAASTITVAQGDGSNITLAAPPSQALAFPNRGTLCISESGVYKLIFRSDKPAARRFQDWVAREVLPAIRKDGGYIMGEEKVRTGEMSEEELLERAAEASKRILARIEEERARAAKLIS